jgi:hypothetical protein
MIVGIISLNLSPAASFSSLRSDYSVLVAVAQPVKTSALIFIPPAFPNLISVSSRSPDIIVSSGINILLHYPAGKGK